jgi:hypothetical protein
MGGVEKLFEPTDSTRTVGSRSYGMAERCQHFSVASPQILLLPNGQKSIPGKT